MTTEPSMQLDLESQTICRRTTDRRTCHTAISDSRSRLVGGTHQCAVWNLLQLRVRNLLTYLFTYLLA